MIKSILKAFAVIAFVGIISLISLYVYVSPDSQLGLAAFYPAYSLFPDKEIFLTLYSPLRRDVDNGNVPAEVERFLLERVERSNEAETLAIANFFAYQSRNGRHGRELFKTSSKTKERLSNILIDNLNADDINFDPKVSLIFMLGTGQDIHKGGLRMSDDNWKAANGSGNFELYQDQWRSRTYPDLEKRLKNWRRSALPWDERRLIDPLKGSEAEVTMCCG